MPHNKDMLKKSVRIEPYLTLHCSCDLPAALVNNGWQLGSGLVVLYCILSHDVVVILDLVLRRHGKECLRER